VTVQLKPDTSLGAQTEAAERERLSALKAKLSPEDLQAIIDNTAALKVRRCGDTFVSLDCCYATTICLQF
jgi:Zn-dependent M16 (insulinase) family peptidase